MSPWRSRRGVAVGPRFYGRLEIPADVPPLHPPGRGFLTARTGRTYKTRTPPPVARRDKPTSALSGAGYIRRCTPQSPGVASVGPRALSRPDGLAQAAAHVVAGAFFRRD